MNRSWVLTADIVVPQGSADGAIISQGGRLCGWGLMIENGKPVFRYNASIEERDHSAIAGAAPLTPGAHRITVEFAYEGSERGAGATVRITADGNPIASGRVPRTPGYLFVSEGGVSIGRDYGTTLSDAAPGPFVYPGVINAVTLDFP